jgi:hypothetical protein
MEYLSNCPRCGRGTMFPKRDFKFKIDYEMCLQCGHVVFNSDDGLGVRRYRIPSKKQRNNFKDNK